MGSRPCRRCPILDRLDTLVVGKHFLDWRGRALEYRRKRSCAQLWRRRRGTGWRRIFRVIGAIVNPAEDARWAAGPGGRCTSASCRRREWSVADYALYDTFDALVVAPPGRRSGGLSTRQRLALRKASRREGTREGCTTATYIGGRPSTLPVAGVRSPELPLLLQLSELRLLCEDLIATVLHFGRGFLAFRSRAIPNGPSRDACGGERRRCGSRGRIVGIFTRGGWRDAGEGGGCCGGRGERSEARCLRWYLFLDAPFTRVRDPT